MGRDSKAEVWKKFTLRANGTKPAGTNGCHATCPHCRKEWKNANVTRLGSHKCREREENATSDIEDDVEAVESMESSDSDRNNNGGQLLNEVKEKESQLKLQKPKQQMKLHTSFSVDGMTPEELRKGHTLCAKAFYSANLSFKAVDNVHLQNFIKFLRPAFKLPSQYQLKTPLLNEEFERVQGGLKLKIQEASVIAIQTDGSTDVCGNGIMNFIVTTPTPYFFKSINRETNRETAAYVADEVTSVIQECDSKKVVLVLTDCAANMRAMWKIIEERYSHISCVGCGDHCLQNFMHDIMKMAFLKKVHIKAKNVIKEFKLSHVRLAALKKIQSEKYEKNKIVSLKLPAKTRFGYVVMTLNSLVKNKEALQTAVIDSSLDVSKKVKKRVLDVDETGKFWHKIDLALQTIRPLAVCIRIMERDGATLSEALEVMFKIKKDVCDFLALQADDILNPSIDSSDFCSLQEIQNINAAFQRRFGMSFRPIHFAASLVDPRFLGRHLTDEQRLDGYQYLEKMATHFGVENRNGEVLENLGHLRDKTGFFAHDMVWKSAATQKPSTWWRGICGSQPLAALGSRLLELPCSTSEAERNWNQHSSTHTKPRNKLKTDKVRKLVSVKGDLNRESALKQRRGITLREVNKYLGVDFSSKEHEEELSNVALHEDTSEDEDEDDNENVSDMEDSDIEVED